MTTNSACISSVNGNVDITSTPNNGDNTMTNPAPATSFKSPFEGKTKAECMDMLADALTPKARELYKKMMKVGIDMENAKLDDLKILRETYIFQSCHCPLHAILWDATDREMTRRWELEAFENGIIYDNPEDAYEEYVATTKVHGSFKTRRDLFSAMYNAMTPRGRRLYDDIEKLGIAIEKLSDNDLKRLQRLAMFQSIHCAMYVILHDAPQRALGLRMMCEAVAE
jgi:hypothetical protein